MKWKRMFVTKRLQAPWQCSLCESCDSKNRGMTYKVQNALYNKKGTM